MKTLQGLLAFILSFIPPAVAVALLLLVALPANTYSQAYHPHGYSRHFTRSGLFSLTEVTQAFGLNTTSKAYSNRFFGAGTVVGYQFSSVLFTGMGAGVLDFNDGVMLPVFLHGRFYFNGIRNTPFISGDAGLLFHVSGQEANTRLFVNPSAGISFKVADYTTVSFAIGLFTQFQKNGGHDSFFNLKLGFSFF